MASPASDPQPIPAADWVAVVTAYTTVLGPPELIPEGSSVEDATEAKWGTDSSYLHLIKDVTAATLTSKGLDVVQSVSSSEDVTSFVKILEGAGLKVKDARSILEIAPEARKRIIQIGIVYLSKGPKTIAESSTVGVMHNPDWSA